LIDEVHSTLKHSQITGGRRFEHILSWIRGCKKEEALVDRQFRMLLDELRSFSTSADDDPESTPKDDDD
jgi:hypothetical protein